MHTLNLEGELTIYTAAKQKEVLSGFLQNKGDLEINLSGVTELDSAGLQLLILAKRESAQRELLLRFVMHSSAVLEALELANLAVTFGDQVVITGNKP